MSSRNSVGVERIGLGLFFLLTVLPVAASLLYAALYGVGAVGLLSHGVTLEYWRRVLTSHEVWASVGLSLYVATAVVFLTALVALPLALALRTRLQSGFLPYVLTLPLAIPGTVAAVLALQILSGAGLLSRLAFHLGLTSGVSGFPSLVHDAALAGVVAAHTALAVPFFVFLFVELHASERVTALQALAASLGASPSQALARVTLPILLRAAVPSLTLLFIVVLGSFEIPWLLGRQAPQMLSVLTYRKYSLFDIAQKPEAYILALAYAALVLGLVAVVFRGRRFGHEV
jgi:putative spermidine/putrescine transport system permease protein